MLPALTLTHPVLTPMRQVFIPRATTSIQSQPTTTVTTATATRLLMALATGLVTPRCLILTTHIRIIRSWLRRLQTPPSTLRQALSLRRTPAQHQTAVTTIQYSTLLQR